MPLPLLQVTEMVLPFRILPDAEVPSYIDEEEEAEEDLEAAE